MSKSGTGFMINLNNVSRISYEPSHNSAISFTMAHEIICQQEFLTSGIIKNRVLDVKFEDKARTKRSLNDFLIF